MTELKPCPFCGGEAKIYETPTKEKYWNISKKSYDILCSECGASMVDFLYRDIAISMWNRRVNNG